MAFDSPPTPVMLGIPTIFGNIKAKHVTFVIDTSGSMYNKLSVVKDHLTETILKHAQCGDGRTFNLIEYSNDVTQWADKMVKCTKETVKVAAGWIRNLAAKTGSNMLDALLTAFEDPQCQAVYLVTDGLPDQHRDDILDNIVPISRGRPVHCIFIPGRGSDAPAVEDLLRSLAMETYGSLEIMNLENHGLMDRVTPVYQHQFPLNGVLRNVSGAAFPAVKGCSVTGTLARDPLNDVALAHWPVAPTVVIDPVTRLPLSRTAPVVVAPNAYPHYYYYPSYWWSRYRTARDWVKLKDKLNTPPDPTISPSAGAMLVGHEVLARRDSDGLYYPGKVQSQITSDLFIVSFGPSKNGDYESVEYQETKIYDIIHKVDALRHSIFRQDKVLAPCQEGSDQHYPGVVIEGQEFRDSKGGEDQQLIVSFCHGPTEKVTLGVAVWIPPGVYERLTVESQMPEDARETLKAEENYPAETLPGYPTTAPERTPKDYVNYRPVMIDRGDFLVDHFYGYPRFMPGYPIAPVMAKVNPCSSVAVHSEDVEKLIPGTDITSRELSEKVQSQISDLYGDKMPLLKKREKQEANTFKKAEEPVKEPEPVAPVEEVPVAEEPEKTDSEKVDENADSGAVFEFDDLNLEDLDLPAEPIDYETDKDYTKERKRVQRPPWSYWRNDPAPSMIDPPGPGAFRETLLQAPLEVREKKMGPYGVEWGGTAFTHAEYNSRVGEDKDAMYEIMHGGLQPRPPSPTKDRRPIEPQPPRAYSPVLGASQHDVDMKDRDRREYRHRKIIQRIQDREQTMAEKAQQSILMRDLHRDRIIDQIKFEKARQANEWDQVVRTRDAKKQISDEIRGRIAEKQAFREDQEQRRFAAVQAAVQRRNDLRAQREAELRSAIAKSKEQRAQQQSQRWNTLETRFETQTRQEAEMDAQRRHANLARRMHFHRMEEDAQKKKNLRVSFNDQQMGLWRSQVLP
ncbi:uncharacterized protein LOC135487663 [Lineus longissimus]|uniref:uncharacterized protein LOC135487663 n=1 Tax=Lineus longissimus TaxID=88925 RepID=UPI00315D929E